jgi:tRNA A-37 threonylcarbamoyl transferase component Bud32
LPDDQLGPRLGAGRDSAIYGLGDDRVVRRVADLRSYETEARLMAYVREAGYPVPRVFRVAPGEIVLERVDGPTMFDDLVRRPWRVARRARLLADLHRRLHELRAPPELGLREGPVPGDTIVHLDLHPQNVILGREGPVVIDWTNARRSDGAVDVADVWILTTAFQVDAPAPVRLLVDRLRHRFADVFLRAAGRADALRVLEAVAEHRKRDPATRAAEAEAIDRMVAVQLGRVR